MSERAYFYGVDATPTLETICEAHVDESGVLCCRVVFLEVAS